MAATLALVLIPALGQAATQTQKRRAAHPAGLSASLGSFTPAAADPRAAATFARGGLDVSGFSFTPSATKGSRRAVTVAVRARPALRGDNLRFAAAAPVSTTITPTAYNLGVSVGWKRFALTGDVSRIDIGVMPGGRESADVALSYGGSKWTTRLALGAERLSGATVPLIGREEGYSVDLGGSYSLTRNIELSAGARYRVQHDRVQPLSDLRRDSQAVYLGTAFRF